MKKALVTSMTCSPATENSRKSGIDIRSRTSPGGLGLTLITAYATPIVSIAVSLAPGDTARPKSDSALVATSAAPAILLLYFVLCYFYL